MKLSIPRTVVLLLVTAVMAAAVYLAFRRADSESGTTSEPKAVLSDTTIARLWFEEGAALTDRSQYDSSLTFFNQASNVYFKDSLWERYVDCMNYLGDNYRRLGKYDTAFAILSANINLGLWRLGEMNASTAMAINKMGLWFRDKGDYDKALEFFNRALRIRARVLPKDHVDIGWSHNNIGLVAFHQGDFDMALRQHLIAIPFFKKAFGENNSNLAQLYGNIGSVYNITGYYDKALEYFHRSLNMRIELFGSENTSVALLYNSLASVYIKQGDFPQASKLLNRAISIQLRHLGESNFETASSFYNLGFVYRGYDDHRNALRMFQKALEIRLSVFGSNHPSVASAYDEIGIEWLEQLQNDSAIAYFQKALDIHINRQGPKSYMRAYELSHIGTAYLSKKNYVKAMEYFDEALRINLEFYGPKHEQVSRAFSDIAQVHQKTYNYVAAIEYIEYAIKSLIWQETSDFSNVQTLNTMNLFVALAAKGDIEYEFANNSLNTDYLREAFASYEAALSITDKIRKEFTLQESKLMLGQKMNTLTEKAIHVAMALFAKTNDESYVQKAFLFSEKNKAIVLSDVLKDEYAKLAVGIPDSLLLYDKQLLSRIGSYNKKLYNEQSSASPRADRIRILQDDIFDATSELDRHIQFIEKKYPQYYNIKYKPIIISPETIRNLLADSTGLIEYFTGNQSLFIFFVGKDTFFCREHTINSDFLTAINSLREGIEKQDYKSFSNSAFLLFEILLKNVPLRKTKQLIFIPDGLLASVPFEVLLMAPPKTMGSYAELDYLIKSCNITYSYSSVLYFQNPHVQTNSGKGLIGFSPSNFK